MVRVEDVDTHHERARQNGARILRPPATLPLVNGSTAWKTWVDITGVSHSPWRTLTLFSGADNPENCNSSRSKVTISGTPLTGPPDRVVAVGKKYTDPDPKTVSWTKTGISENTFVETCRTKK